MLRSTRHVLSLLGASAPPTRGGLARCRCRPSPDRTASPLRLSRRFSVTDGRPTTEAAGAGEDGGHHLMRYAVQEDSNTIHACPQAMPSSFASTESSLSSGLYTSSRNLIKSFPPERIRNVSIVAHVDHGKTTLTDALLRRAGLLPADGATGTFTDRLAVERDRGITVKAQTCSLFLSAPRRSGEGGRDVYLINLIDTPGHVDFQYEVSRSLSASEGALLLVDVSQGVEAQTMAQFHTSLEHDLAIVPVLTKMDQVLSDDVVDRALAQLEDSTGLLRQEVVMTSAKHKKGMEAVFQAIIDHVPAPATSPDAGPSGKEGRQGFSELCQLPPMRPDSEERKAAEASLVPLRALLFDCWTAESSGMTRAAGPGHEGGAPSPSFSSASPPPLGKEGSSLKGAVVDASPQRDGVYCLVRVISGTATPGTRVTFFHSNGRHEVREVGILHPSLYPTAALTAGMVGYLFFPRLKRADIVIGDTLCTLPTKRHFLAKGDHRGDTADRPFAVHPVPGFRRIQPVVFAGFYPDEGKYVSQLRDAVDLLCVNDPSVTVESIQCQALGSGLQLGFLGLLHMQVFQERLRAEFDQTVLVTPPQVQYMGVEVGADPADPQQRKPLSVSNWRWPHEGIATYLEPFVMATVVTPKDYFNAINAAALSQFRGEQTDMRVVDDARVLARYHMPLADLARGFASAVKSFSHGYATLDYDIAEYVPADLVKVDIAINKARLSALSLICPRHEANAQGRRILSSLKENLTRSSVDLPLQALVGKKIIARDTVKAYRKDVTAKIHAGDISRKRKKWDDQRKGKERMARRSFGTVVLDQSVLAAAMGASTVK